MPPACDPRFDAGLDHGELIWTRSIPTEYGGGIRGVAVSSSGSIFAAGRSGGPDPWPADPNGSGWFVHLSADGAVQAELIRDLADDMGFMDVAAAPDGSAVVVGYERGLGQTVAVAYAIRQDGTQTWRRELDFGLDSLGAWQVFVDVSPQGRIIVAMNGERPSGWPDGWDFIELSATGETVRVIHPPEDAPAFHRVRSLGFDSAGILYAATVGRHAAGSDDVEWVGRWDVGGTFLGAWERPTDRVTLVDLNPREDGATILTYTRVGPDDAIRPELRRLDEAGNERWITMVEFDEVGPFFPNNLLARRLATDCLGRSWVLAQELGLDSKDTDWLFVYDEEGVEVERQRFEREEDPPDYRFGDASIAIDPFGNVVLARNEFDASSSAMLVQMRAR